MQLHRWFTALRQSLILSGLLVLYLMKVKPREGRKTTLEPVNGVFWLLLLNITIYVLDHRLKIHQIRILYLHHSRPYWYQFVSSTFCHGNWDHLSSNLFFLYIFGKLVEEEQGSFALYISYMLTGGGAAFISWLLRPSKTVSGGSSGAVFGLFAISVVIKLHWEWRKILEVLILGQFVIKQVLVEAQASTTLNGASAVGKSNIDHVAHLSGAFVGVILVWLIPLGMHSNSNSNSG